MELLPRLCRISQWCKSDEEHDRRGRLAAHRRRRFRGRWRRDLHRRQAEGDHQVQGIPGGPSRARSIADRPPRHCRCCRRPVSTPPPYTALAKAIAESSPWPCELCAGWKMKWLGKSPLRSSSGRVGLRSRRTRSSDTCRNRWIKGCFYRLRLLVVRVVEVLMDRVSLRWCSTRGSTRFSSPRPFPRLRPGKYWGRIWEQSWEASFHPLDLHPTILIVSSFLIKPCNWLVWLQLKNRDGFKLAYISMTCLKHTFIGWYMDWNLSTHVLHGWPT